MESFLKQNKDIDVVVAQNDNMAFGAIDALKAAGKTPGKDVTIISFDAIKAALKKVQSERSMLNLNVTHFMDLV